MSQASVAHIKCKGSRESVKLMNEWGEKQEVGNSKMAILNKKLNRFYGSRRFKTDFLVREQ